MINPVIFSKLEASQVTRLNYFHESRPEVNVSRLAELIADEIFDRGLNITKLLEAVELLGPYAVDKGKRMWQYSHGVWLPNGEDDLTMRIVLCTGSRYRKDHVNQVASIIKARSPRINGLGPKNLINVRNGMLDWVSLELTPHDPKFYSTYQVNADWNPKSECPVTDAWMDSIFEPEIKKLLWQVMGVTIYPAMGFQKAIALIGGGLNGKGTFLRLCRALLPETAISAIDPKVLSLNRFASAELFGKTANICGDIERSTFNSTGEFKKITGEDSISAERKNGHPFTFTSQATMLFSGNKMPASRDVSYGWFRRWLIIPMTRQITGTPDRTLNDRMAVELDGVLVQAVMGLQEAMDQGGYDEPEICLQAQMEYEFSCNTSALFINEKLEFSEAYKAPVSRSVLFDNYVSFCRERRVEQETRPKFFEMVETLGGNYISSHWTKKPSGEDDRGYVGINFKSIYGHFF
jgi:P4 family phage/plasmid primase-like protien